MPSKVGPTTGRHYKSIYTKYPGDYLTLVSCYETITEINQEHKM